MLFILLSIFITLSSSEIIDGTIDNFFDNIQQRTIVKFYARWCGHCKSLEPIFQELSEIFENDIKFMQVECDISEELCLDEGVKGFPIIRIYNQGVMENEYEGPRDLLNLGRFIKGETIGKPETRVFQLTKDNFYKIVEDETKNVVVKFYVPWCNVCKGIQPKYEKLIDIYEPETDLVIAEMDCDDKKNKEICKGRFKIDSYPTITFFPKDFKYGKDFTFNHEVITYVNRMNREFHYHRDEYGHLDKTAGTHRKIDKLIYGFKKMSLFQQNEIKTKIENLKLKEKENYLPVIERIMNEGSEFIEVEIENLRQEIQNCYDNEDRDELQIKMNILKQFTY